jgi:hypothetical protein
MRGVGLVIKASKVQSPTADGLEALGMLVHGRRLTIGVAAHKRYQMVIETEELCQRGQCTGLELAKVVGSWTWAVLARRAALAVFSAVYRFIEAAKGHVFTVWQSVKRELRTICGLAPLLFARLALPTAPIVTAVDASLSGMGVVSRTASAGQQLALEDGLRPYLQLIGQDKNNREKVETGVSAVLDNALSGRRSLPASRPPRSLPVGSLPSLHPLHVAIGRGTLRWNTIASDAWRWREQINVLEARALYHGVRHIVEVGGAGCRALVLSDSTVVTYAARKGRASSFGVLRQLRRTSAMLLAYDVAIAVLWVPSALNPADGPSRRFEHHH